MIKPDLKGRGLFVFSDPGGAKPLLAYIKLNTHLTEFIAVSDRVYDFYADFDITVISYFDSTAESVIQSFKPDFIFTGTSYTSTIELEYLEYGLKSRISCYSFIDHYTNFKERFFLKGTFVYPDFICVVDDRALSMAEEAKLPRPLLNTGNFYHHYLEGWEPEISKSDFMDLVGLPASSKIIVFAPDPLTNVGGTEKWGLDEVTVWKSLENTLKHYSHLNYQVILKLHPNQRKNNIIPQVQSSPIKVIFNESLHTNTLLYYSSCVIGMFSNILTEADLFGVPVIRYLNGLKIGDPLESMNIGTIAKSDYQLFNLIKAIFKYE